MSFQEKVQKLLQRMRKILEFVIEFCSITNIHGVPYFTKAKRHWTERLFWLVAFGASLYFCIIFAQSIFLQWKESPIKMQLMDTTNPISTIPFPTVTICLDAKANGNILNVTHMKEILAKSPKGLTNSEYAN